LCLFVAKSPPSVFHQVEAAVLTIHRRNGGSLTSLDAHLRLLDRSLMLDSLDLAEIMVAIERQHGVSPFDAPEPPRTWQEVIDFVARENGVGSRE
jgi:acyl carrier protein